MGRQGSLGLLILFLVVFATGPAQAGWDPELEKKAQETIEAFKKADPAINTFFEKAYGYAVFPRVGKGAVGIGGARGNGVLYEQGVPIGTTTLTQFTIGFQLGGQAYSEIIFFKDKATLDDFKKGNFELGAQASAVAADSGAAANADYSRGVAIFTLVRGGLMFEASVGGQKFAFEPK